MITLWFYKQYKSLGLNNAKGFSLDLRECNIVQSPDREEEVWFLLVKSPGTSGFEIADQ